VQKLKKKFKQKCILSCIEIKQRLNQVQMKRRNDSAILFETLAIIEEQYDGIGNIDDSDCSMLREQSQFMIYFRLFLELNLVFQTGMTHDSNI
jgi:hypothetical protein